MAPQELRDTLTRQPFQPFRIVMSDGKGFDIHHPDLLWVGLRSATVGLTGEPGKTFYERSVQVDLSHLIRLEPVEHRTTSSAETEG